MKEFPLILAPFSDSAQRQLWLTEVKLPCSHSAIEFYVTKESHETFSFSISMLKKLQEKFPSSHKTISDSLSLIQTVSNSQSEDFALSDSNFTSDAVQFAVLRRISRESVYTATVIDEVAKNLNEALSENGVTDAVIYDFDRIDRPSLKILCRAALVLKKTQNLTWHWVGGKISNSIFLDCPEVEKDWISRKKLLKQIYEVIDPQINYPKFSNNLNHKKSHDYQLTSNQPKTVLEISRDLVMQNYDGCFQWAKELHDYSDDPLEKSEALRLLALTAVNAGFYHEAINFSQQAENTAPDPVTKAKICYMSGLIYAKRLYDSKLALIQYEKGIKYLENSQANSDVLVEQAWLKNGVALLNALSWKKTENDSDYNAAFNLVNEAFWLISDIDTPACAYLRFNLLANAAFLMEMRGDFHAAISVFENVFEQFALRDKQSARGQMTINYRMAGLKIRAQDLAGALSHISRVIEAEEELGCPFMADHVYRLVGYFYFITQDYEKAYLSFEKGLDITYEARLGTGYLVHITGLISTLKAQGRTEEINSYFDLLDELDYKKLINELKNRVNSDNCLPAPPHWKLPAYIPEVDLEDLPTSNLNRKLTSPAVA